MATNHKLALFDIDGTIAVKSVIPTSVHEGFRHLQECGYLTTVSTGRAYSRTKDVLGDHFDTIIAPDSLIILEHGTKITHKNGEVAQADYFGKAEVEHVVDFLHANEDMMVFLSYATADPNAPHHLWVKEGEDMEAVKQKRGHYADVFQSTYDELKARMHKEQISHVLAKMQDFITVENLKLHFTRSDMDVIFMDGYMQFLGNLSDKSKAILFLEKFHNVPIKDMLIAGNGINDVDMLNMQAGHRILVGTDEQARNVIGHLRDPEEVIRVESPEALGVYLQQMS